ncbi:hypothetical protein B5G28_11610 [Faecalibacterium sp. An77]|uniref:hypothetical protein n=1 Tax=Faecalibacterium sp. An77 TaxID=1965655 RepID=UPI000B3A10F8|nr:hypothetical protein [Faecalibacterium sp. An77]OUN36742.1 hypothetical protein B5G28_11610 [Faecalibacterium sp. An77]
MPDLYGFTPTNAGRGLIASLLAGETLTITRAMVGSGKPDSLEAMAALTDLVAPVAQATSTTPVRTEDAISLTVEYRSDMNGGLQEGFAINEYGLFAKTDESAETLIFYGCLGDHPQWVYPYSPGVAPDVRDYPVKIQISSEVNVQIDYHADAFITAEEAAALLESMVQNAAGADILEITVPADAWALADAEGEEETDFPYCAEVAADAIRASHYPVVTIHPDALDTAFRAGLCPAVQAEDGALRFWARRWPAGDLAATVLLQSRSGGGAAAGGGSDYVLPPATQTTLGGVMVGENIHVTDDGKISVEDIPEPATDEEIRDIVSGSFASDAE